MATAVEASSMITGSEMAVVDANAAALGVSRKQLMESSGNAVAGVVRQVATPGDTVTVLAGRGNNGGDAFVAARFLDEFDVSVRLLGRAETITTDIARENWDALHTGGYDVAEVRDSTALELEDADVLVDAMLGTGIRGDLREPEASAARLLNEAESPVVSVDVPSGLDTETGVLAENAVETDYVVTFHAAKPGLDDLDAAVTVADIGVPAAAETFVGRGDLLRLGRDPHTHKGAHGDVLVLGGGPYTGAPALTAQALLRAGADLAKVACPDTIAREVQAFSENVIVYPLAGDRLEPGHVDAVLEYATEHDVLVVGPGLGDDERTLQAVARVLESYEGTAVVDADALQVVPAVETQADLVCTPHQGELLAMGGETSDDWRERRDLVSAFADELDQTLLVKGPHDVVADRKQSRVNRTGNPGMTVGGTGDVLAGVTAALASTHDPFDAACLGAYVTGRAGDLVAEKYGNGLLATDLLDAIPQAMNESA